jgi:hypothetical protein
MLVALDLNQYGADINFGVARVGGGQLRSGANRARRSAGGQSARTRDRRSDRMETGIPRPDNEGLHLSAAWANGMEPSRVTWEGRGL